MKKNIAVLEANTPNGIPAIEYCNIICESIFNLLQNNDMKATTQALQGYQKVEKKHSELMSIWNIVILNNLPALNKQLAKNKMPAIPVFGKGNN